MADLDTLQIQISATSKQADRVIESLCKSLGNLQKSLESFSDSSAYVRGLSNLAGGLEKVGSSINSIDKNKIIGITQALTTLAKAGDKISTMSFAKSMSQMGAEAQNAMNKITGAVQQAEDTLDVTIKNPFEGIVTGLMSLEGVSVGAEQFTGLTPLADGITKLNAVDPAKLASSLPTIASALESLSSVSVPNITGLDVLAKGLRSLGSGNIVSAANSLPRIASGLRELQGIDVSGSIESWKAFANTIGYFGRQAAREAVTNIPLLASAFRELINSLAKAPLVKQNTIDLANAMANLAANCRGVGSATISASSGLRLFSASTKKAKSSTHSLAATFGKLYANYFLIIRAIKSLGKAVDIASDLREVQNVVATVFGSATGKIQEFADEAIEKFGMSELSAKKFASRFQAMGTAMDVTSKQVVAANDFIASKLPNTDYAYKDLGDSMADVSINLTKLTADMASFYNEDYEDVAEDMAAVMTGMTRPLRKYGLDLTEATLKEWALKNGLEGDIKSMSQAEKTMLRYQYVMSQTAHIMGDFQKTSDTWANVTRTIGQQFQKLGQIIGQGFINALKPALIAFRGFMNTIIELAEKAMNALGKLMGWSIEIEDVGVSMDDGMEDYADAIDDANGSAKKLLKTLLPIDELNVLSDPSKGGGSDSGASGDGGSGTVTGGGITFKPYESDIEDWYDFGKRIADKLRDAMDSINWDSIFGKAKDFGKNLAEFLNGLISPETFGALGRTIANALNSIVYRALSFAEHFDFTNLGVAFGEMINNFLETFDFEATAQAISKLANGFLDFANTAVSSVKWEEVGEKLVEFFCGIDWKETWFNLSDLVVAIYRAMKGVIKGALKQIEEDPSAFGEAIINFSGLALLVGGAKLSKALLVYELKKAVNLAATGKLGETIGKKLGGSTLVKGFNTALAGAGGLKNFLTLDMAGLVGEGAVSAGVMIGTAIASSIVTAIVGFKLGKKIGAALNPEDKEFYENFKWFGDEGFFDTLISSIKDGSITGAFALMKEDIYNFFLDFRKAQEDFTADNFPWIAKMRDAISDFNTDFTNDVKQAVSDAKQEFDKFGEFFKGLGKNISDWFTNSVMPYFTKEKWLEIGNNLKDGLSSKWSEFTTWWDNTGFKQWWDSSVTPWFTKDQWIQFGTNIKDAISEKWGEFTNWWDSTGFKGWWDDVSSKFSKEAWTWDGITEGLTAAWNNAIEAIKNIWNVFAGWLNEKLNLSWDALSIAGKEIIPAGHLDLGKIPTFAQGGYPDTGSLFFAGESGAELLGTVGGNTAVASNGEITGIASAIYETASQTNALLRGVITAIDNKETGISSETIFASVRSSAKSYRMRTGADAFV